jgi:hypothetical protein
MSNAIVPVVPKRNAVTGAGYPASLALGEIAVNTTTGNVYLGADPGVVQIGIPVAAGTTLNLGTGDGSAVAFAITGGTGTDAGGYLVSVGGIDQPSGWTVAGTTLTFSEAPPAGSAVSVRAILQGSGGSGSSNATQLQGRDIATTAPTDGQVLMWSETNNRWEPSAIGGSVTFNTEGTHYWRVPAYVRYAQVQASAGNGTAGTNGQGTDGQDGQDGLNGANGTDGEGTIGSAGKSITFDGVTVNGGTAGEGGSTGYGGGGGGFWDSQSTNAGSGLRGNGPEAGNGGDVNGNGGSGYENGTNANGSTGGTGGTGGNGGGNGGNGASAFGPSLGGGGGGSGANGSGGGGGGGAFGYMAPGEGRPGQGGKGGTGSGATAGGTGETLDTAHLFTAGALVPITISAGAGTASITITY